MVSYMIQDGDQNCTEGATILDISNEKLRPPLPQFKDGKNGMFRFSCEPITELGGWEVLFLFLFYQDCPKFTMRLPEAIYIIFQKMKAAGERSKNKRCIKKNLSGEKKEPCAGLRHEIIYNKVIP